MTNKKFYLVGMAVLLSVSLFVIGCPTEADAGPQGQQGNTFPPALPAGATPALLAKYYSDGATTVYLDAAPAAETFIVPENKTLTVVGDVALASGTVINAFEGTLDVAGGRFTGTNGVLIVADAKAAAVKDKAVYLTVPKYVAAIGETPTAITEDVVLSSLTIGGSATGAVSVADFGTFAGAAYNVYVTGDVVIDGTLDTSNAKLTVYGDVTAKGSLTVGANTTIGKVTATGALTLAGTDIDELDTATFTVTSAKTSIALDKLDSGTGGKLALTGNVTAVTIGEGSGIIEFDTGAPAFATSASSFGNTGLTTFKADVTAAIGITFTGPVAFDGTLTSTNAAALVFDSNLTVGTGKATSLGGNLTVDGTAAFGGTLTNSAVSVAEFNGATTVTGVLTTGTGGLTIGGTGAVGLTVAPTLTNGLTVTNLTGVTIPSATIPVSKSIDADAGKVIFGTDTNSVTIENGTLTSAAGGTATVAANGVVTLAYSGSTGASLVLADGGSVAVAGTGKVAIGTTAELKGAGSAWTAGTDTVTFAASGAAAATITGGTSATLTPSGADAELYLLAASAAQALTIGGTIKFTLDLSTTGKITFDKTTADSTITLTANTDGIKLTDSLAIVGTSTAGSAHTGAIVDGTGTYVAATLNVSLVDGVIQHSSTNDAAPAAIDKTTVVTDLAVTAS